MALVSNLSYERRRNPMNKIESYPGDDKKSSLRKKRILRAKQEKFARLLKLGVIYKLGNIQGFTFHK